MGSAATSINDNGRIAGTLPSQGGIVWSSSGAVAGYSYDDTTFDQAPVLWRRG